MQDFLLGSGESKFLNLVVELDLAVKKGERIESVLNLF